MKDLKIFKKLEEVFIEIFDPTEKKDLPSKSISSYIISYKDFIFGLFSLYWRLDTFQITKEFEKIGPDLKGSLGKYLEQNAIKYANNKASTKKFNVAMLTKDQHGCRELKERKSVRLKGGKDMEVCRFHSPTLVGGGVFY